MGKILYNVTVKTEQAIAPDWLEWLQKEHIPDMIQTGCFTHATVLRLLEVDETEGPTYAVQYHAESQSLYNRYIREFADNLRQKGYERWGNRFIAFRSVMQVLE